MTYERTYTGREDNVKDANPEIASYEKETEDIKVPLERRNDMSMYIESQNDNIGLKSEIEDFVARARSITVPQQTRKKVQDIPIWEKSNLTLDEAAAYSGIGKNKLREISNENGCTFVLFVGGKRLIKRRKLDEYIEESYAI